MINLHKVNSASIPAGMDALYIGSFPAEERRPWDEILRLTDNDERFSFHVVTANGDPAGFITTWDLGEARYVEHFAIHPSMRGKGIGLEAIRQIIASEGAPVVLEVEPADSGETARRRIAFYTRAGLNAHHDFNYIQPPYSPGLPSVPLTLMTSSPLPLDSITRLLHKEVYGVESTKI